MKNKIHFFQVSLKENIPIIDKNYSNIKKFYNNFSLTIICKDKEYLLFKKSFFHPEINIIRESRLIKFNVFKNIFYTYCRQKIFFKKNQWRTGWYYQQVLKICYVFFFFNKFKSNKLVLWDADTIMLEKINFFNENNSILYGTFFEFNKKYFKTLFFFFKKLPSNFLSGTCQFHAISNSDFLFLKSSVVNFLKHKNVDSKSIAHMFGRAVFHAHKKYFVSLISEQDLLTISKLLYSQEKQKPILYFRTRLNGLLDNSQICLLKKMKFSHLTYEKYAKASKIKLNYMRFFYLLIKFKLIFSIKNFLYRYNFYQFNRIL
jgi:hypothetical protein